MKQRKKLVVLGVLVIGVVLVAFFVRPASRNASVHPQVFIEGVDSPISVEIADTDTLRSRGLSGHQPLGEYEGMLFVFDRPDRPGFWMKDMDFPIDIVWIGPDWKVIDVTRDLDPASYPATVTPIADAQYVLEVNAGFVARHDIHTGESVGLVRPGPSSPADRK